MELILQMIAAGIDIIHKEILMRNAYDVGMISKEHYIDYLTKMLYIPEEEEENEK